MTNITAGVENTVDCIIDAERAWERANTTTSARKGHSHAAPSKPRTHHVIVLLTDGTSTGGLNNR